MRRRWHCTGNWAFSRWGGSRDFYTDSTEDALLLTKTFKKEEPDG